jgi:hypothetical protein
MQELERYRELLRICSAWRSAARRKKAALSLGFEQMRTKMRDAMKMLRTRQLMKSHVANTEPSQQATECSNPAGGAGWRSTPMEKREKASHLEPSLVMTRARVTTLTKTSSLSSCWAARIRNTKLKLTSRSRRSRRRFQWPLKPFTNLLQSISQTKS